MNELQTLYKSILADPESDTPRGVFADFCRDSGREDVADYINESIWLARNRCELCHDYGYRAGCLRGNALVKTCECGISDRRERVTDLFPRVCSFLIGVSGFRSRWIPRIDRITLPHFGHEFLFNRGFPEVMVWALQSEPRVTARLWKPSERFPLIEIRPEIAPVPLRNQRFSGFGFRVFEFAGNGHRSLWHRLRDHQQIASIQNGPHYNLAPLWWDNLPGGVERPDPDNTRTYPAIAIWKLYTDYVAAKHALAEACRSAVATVQNAISTT